jgi:hypothetical protein
VWGFDDMGTDVNWQDERKEIKERIKLENDLIHQRMSWFSTFQGLLFGAVAFAWDKTGAKPITFIACLAGIVVSISVGYSLYRANVAIDRASAKWDEIKPEGHSGLDSEGVRSGSRLAWLMPGWLMPWVFALMWCGVFVVALMRPTDPVTRPSTAPCGLPSEAKNSH